MTRFLKSAAALGALAIAAGYAPAIADDDANPLASLPLRAIGPAYTGGRISDFAMFPGGNNHYLVGTASGGLWRTTDNGSTIDLIDCVR